MSNQVAIGSCLVDDLTVSQAADRIVAWCSESVPHARVIVTPNIQHVHLAARDPQFRRAYDHADLVLPDGWPVAVAMSIKLRRRVLRAAGSDLILELLERAGDGSLRVAFFGGADGVAKLAAEQAVSRWPRIRIVQIEALPRGSFNDAAQLSKMCDRIAQAQPELLLLGLGAPKQELFADQVLRNSQSRVVVCIGAGIDFVAGTKRRAPSRMQKFGLEWLWRLMLEPRRLSGRYLSSALWFPILVFRGRRSE